MSDAGKPPNPLPPAGKTPAQISALGALIAGAAIAVVSVVVGINFALEHTAAPASEPPAVAPPTPITQVNQLTVRGAYPAETETSFLQSCESSAGGTGNAKCACDLSKLEAYVPLDRLLAIESATSSGGSLPDDVSAMFDSCKTING